MKQFFIRLFSPLIRDDLFLRVTCSFVGLSCWAIAGLLATVPLEGKRLQEQILLLAFVVVFAAIGAPFVLRSVLSVRSRAGELFDRHMTPINLFVGLAMADSGLMMLFLPAILLTLLLRGLGIRGQSWRGPVDQTV